MSDYPRVTFALLAFKQEAFVRAAVEGALAQDYPNLQLLISDDCSPDATYAVMQEATACYCGPHDVSVLRTPRNLGLSKHLQTLVAAAEGELIVLAAGDDISAAGRTTRLVEAWQANGGGPAVLYSDCRMMNLAGDIIVSRSPKMQHQPPSFEQACRGILEVHGATTAVTTAVFQQFPAMASEVVHEDRVLPFRALLLGGKIVFVDESLVDYRFEGGVSRLPKDPAEASRFQLLGQRRGLADSRQRLADLRHARPNDHKAQRVCQLTIQDHQNAIALREASTARYELILLQRLISGGHPLRTIRTYVRLRRDWLGAIRRRAIARPDD